MSLPIKIKQVKQNCLGNLEIKGDCSLCDNEGNNIGKVKITVPNCYFDNNGNVIAKIMK